MTTEKRIINPENSQKIILSENNIQEKIIITDLEKGNRDFSLEVVVQGENSTVEIIGRAESRDIDKKKWKISLILEGKNQKGILDLKGVSDEKGNLEFDGGGIATQQSSQGNINVQEKIVLFSPTSTAKNIPVLRVETEDIASASHSASIAPFNKEIFFFLESRGVSPEEGKKLLREGFLEV